VRTQRVSLQISEYPGTTASTFGLLVAIPPKSVNIDDIVQQPMVEARNTADQPPVQAILVVADA
jgi:hypothetical protein